MSFPSDLFARETLISFLWLYGPCCREQKLGSSTVRSTAADRMQKKIEIIIPIGAANVIQARHRNNLYTIPTFLN
jgi:hypothetical protein